MIIFLSYKRFSAHLQSQWTWNLDLCLFPGHQTLFRGRDRNHSKPNPHSWDDRATTELLWVRNSALNVLPLDPQNVPVALRVNSLILGDEITVHNPTNVKENHRCARCVFTSDLTHLLQLRLDALHCKDCYLVSGLLHWSQLLLLAIPGLLKEILVDSNMVLFMLRSQEILNMHVSLVAKMCLIQDD